MREGESLDEFQLKKQLDGIEFSKEFLGVTHIPKHTGGCHRGATKFSEDLDLMIGLAV